MPRTDEEQALDAVVDDMSAAARRAKAAKYTPKPKPPEAAPVETAAEAPQLGAAELESLLNGG